MEGKRTELESGPSEDDLLPWRQWVGRLRAELELEQQRTQAALSRVRELESSFVRLVQGLQYFTTQVFLPAPWMPPPVRQSEIEALAVHKTPGASAERRLASSSKEGASNGAASAASRGEASCVESEMRVSIGESRLLGALATRGPLTKKRLALITGYHHTAGKFSSFMAAFRSRGWVGPGEDGTLSLTDEGRLVAKDAPAPPGPEELCRLWERKLSEEAVKVFLVVRKAGKALSREQIGKASGMAPKTQRLEGALAELRRYGLVEGTDRAVGLGEAREDFR